MYAFDADTGALYWQSVLLAAGETPGDGKQDILWRNPQTGEVDIWFMSGASVVSKVNVGIVSLNWKIVGIADFNGDRQSDILWQNTIDGSFVIWIMHGSSHSDYEFPSQGNQWYSETVFIPPCPPRSPFGSLDLGSSS